MISRRCVGPRALAAGLTLLGLGLASARAEVTGFHLTLSPYGGVTRWDRTLHLQTRAQVGARGGLMFGGWFGVEGDYGAVFTRDDDEIETRADHIGADAVLNLFPGSLLTPYLLGGWAQIQFDPDRGETQTFNGWEAGGGLKIRLVERMALRFEARDVLIQRDAPAPEDWTHNLFVSGGLHFTLGGKVRDTDGDGVGDRRDLCPATPAGATVDAKGCPTDGDGDGVWDGIDQCAGTAAGALVDARGCPSDTDGDGVWDGLDQCGATPAGATVDARGCPTDTDGDGVWDGIDQCANTPSGAGVNDIGCPIDSDHDGVYDGLDLCANTPEDVRVDKNGCPIEVSEKETQLLDTGMIRIDNIEFETGKWDLAPGSEKVLDEVGNILVQWPQLQIEIGGHTDSRGSEAYNLELSQKRAQAVLDYLTAKFPSLSASQYTAKGYGESKPLESNASELGRAKNRRVEFTVLNREVLRKEIDRRKILKKD